MNKYLVLKESSCPLFLVDRNKTKRFWWSYKLKFAMLFYSYEEANRIASNLKYGNIRVITEREAVKIRDKFTAMVESSNIENEFHPNDPYSLGQE